MTLSSAQTYDDLLELVASGAIAVDSLNIIGNRLALAENLAASGATIPAKINGRVTKTGAKATGEAWTLGQRIYFDEVALKCTTTRKRIYVGLAASAQGSTSTVADVIFGEPSGAAGIIDTLLLNTDSVGNLAAETAFAKSITIKANSLQAGDIIAVEFQGIVTAQNSTDTHRARLRLGTASLAGTLLLDTGAVDPGTSDIFGGAIDLLVRSIGATGKVYGRIREQAYLAAAGTAATKPGILAEFTLDTTVDQILSIGMTHSVANVGNTDRLDAFYAFSR